MKKLMMIVAMGALPFTAACGGATCESVCDDMAACADYDEELMGTAADCKAACEDNRQAAADAGCGDQYGAMEDCAYSDIGDVCEPATDTDTSKCEEELADLLACAITSAG